MNQKIVRAAFGILTLIVTVSCTTAPPRQNSIAGSGAVEDVALIEKRIRIYGKYDRAIPEIIHDLKQCAPLRKPSEGIRKWDQGQRSQALELYNAALEVFPKNPWALWELALDHLTYDFDSQELTDGRFDARYRLIRRLDPHYESAFYQGQNTPEKRTAASALTEKVLPGFAGLYKGENVLVNMRSLADGYFEMREYEFAIYAYKYILFRSQVERMITSERKRLQAAREQVAQIQAEGHSRISSSTLWKPLTRV